MKKVLLGLGILTLAASISFGQKAGRAKPLREGENSGSKQLALTSDTRLDAQLQSTLDVKSAKVGDQVVFKTTKAVKQNGETVIQKGSTLYGHVTEVQQRTSANAMSKIGMVFDRIESNNLSAPISASIVSITNAAAHASADDMLSSDISGSSQTSGRTSSGGSTSSGSGGGLLGGVGNAVGSTVGGVVNTTTQTVGSVAGTAGNVVGSTAGTVGRTVGGIQISSSTSASANGSTTLSSPNKNLRLEKGLTFLLNVDGSVQNN
jgi:hypothetical protein